MRLCIPTEDAGGLEAVPAGHFGRAAFFTLVEGESGAVEVVANHPRAGGHGSCSAWQLLGLGAGDVVACRGMGQGARQALGAAGVGVVVAEGGQVGEVVAAWRAGRLHGLAEAESCACGHGHGEHHHHHQGTVEASPCSRDG